MKKKLQINIYCKLNFKDHTGRNEQKVNGKLNGFTRVPV